MSKMMNVLNAKRNFPCLGRCVVSDNDSESLTYH